MDSRCRAWKLRNSTEIWRPNKHALNNANASAGRGKLSASDSDYNLPAMMRDNEKTLQAKWKSTTFFSQDTSSLSAGSKSPSPILRCRTVSPDLCRTLSADHMRFSESASQAQGKVTITSPEAAAVPEHVVSGNAEPKSSAAIVGTLIGVEGIAAPDSRVYNHQRPRRSTASSRTALAAQKGVVSRPASVSPQMWQEKIPVPKNRTDRSVVACRRWQSPQGAVAFGTRTPKKMESEAKNKCLPQSLDVFFVPGVPLPSFTRLQRSIVGNRVPSFPVDQMLLPLPQDLQNELVLCSAGTFPNKMSCTKKASPCVGDRAHLNNQDALTVSSLRSPEQCILMRINMAFEPGVKHSTPFKSDHWKENKTEGWSSSTVLRKPEQKEMIHNQIVKDATQSQRPEASILSLQSEDELWAQRGSHDLEATHVLSSSDPGERLKGESVECDVREIEVKCEAPEEQPSSVCEAIEGSFEVAEAQVSLRRRRWPKVPPSISDKDLTERLSTTLTASSSDSLSEESAPKPEIKEDDDLRRVKSVGCHEKAVSKTHTVQNEAPLDDSVRMVGSSQDNGEGDSCLVGALTQNTEKSRNGLLQGGSPTADMNSRTGVSRIRSEKLPEKAVVRSSEKWNGEVLRAFSSITDSEPKAGVFSLKSKRSLERATLDIIEKKRRDESSQRSTAAENEPKRTSIHNKILTNPEGTFTKDLTCTEMERKEESDSSPQKSLKMRIMSISGPSDSFREISIEDSCRALQVPSIEGEACNSDRSCTRRYHLELPNILQPGIQQRDLTCKDQVLGLPGQEAGCSNLQDIVTVGSCIEQSYHRVSSLGRIQDHVTNSSSSGICNNTQPRDPSEVISPQEENLISDDISRKWSNPLHQETGSADRASLSSEKFSSILSYLGHVEESNMQDNFKLLQKRDVVLEGTSSSLKGSQSPCTVLEQVDSVSLANSTFTTSLTNISSNQSGDVEVGVSPATSLFEGVRKKMQEFRSKIAAKESQNVELLRDMERLEAEKERALSLERDRFGRELEVRAGEYKAAILHHLALNEKMVKDKEALSEKCCNLAGILSTVESKYEDKMKVLKEQFAQELKKQKEIWIAGEKPRRDVWKEKKIKEIKELTIKGLEPHIDGLNEKYKQEIKRLEMRYADETQKKLEVQSIQHRQEMCELRNRFLKERDEILEKERLAALTRLNDVAEKYEHQAMEFRRKVSSDMAEELEKVEEARRKDKQMSHEMLSKVREEWHDRETAMKNSREKGIQEAIAEKDTEIRSLRSELEKLKNDWQKDFDEKLHQNIQVKEDEFKSRCTKERDEQIEMIIERMENEKDEAIAQHQQELLARVETLMEEKLELMKKLKEVESKCASLCKISLEAKQKAEMETANKDLQVESKRREVLCQADLIEQLKAQIQQEKKNLKEHEQRHELRLAKEQELLQSVQLDVEKCKAETQQLKLRKAKELEEVEIHVRQAIENKDQIIAGLREQLLAAREQMRHTELLLQQEHVAFSADHDCSD